MRISDAATEARSLIAIGRIGDALRALRTGLADFDASPEHYAQLTEPVTDDEFIVFQMHRAVDCMRSGQVRLALDELDIALRPPKWRTVGACHAAYEEAMRPKKKRARKRKAA